MKSTLKEIEEQVHPANTRAYWIHISNKFGISQTLACAISQPSGKSILRLEGRKKEDLIMEIHNLQGTVKDIERIVPGCNKAYIEKVIKKSFKEKTINDELVEYRKEDKAVDEMKNTDIPKEVIVEAEKSDMPLYDFVTFLYENYKEETTKPTKEVEVKEVQVPVPVEQKQIKFCTIIDRIQNQDSYPDMRKLKAAFEIVSGIINRTIPCEKLKDLKGEISK